MNADELRHFLLSIPHFTELGSGDLVALERSLELRTVEDGHVFFRQGDAGDGVYLLLSGQVAVDHERSSGAVTEVNRMVERELFGILALLDDIPRTATCTAEGPCTVGYLPNHLFWTLAGTRAAIGYPFQRVLARQLAKDFRVASARIDSLIGD